MLSLSLLITYSGLSCFPTDNMEEITGFLVTPNGSTGAVQAVFIREALGTRIRIPYFIKAALTLVSWLQLEEATAEWTLLLGSALQKEAEKAPQGKGPLAEIEFWRERNASLGSLYEQLNTPQAKKVVATLEAGSGDANLLMRFKAQVRPGGHSNG
jgi:hypothetical protein